MKILMFGWEFPPFNSGGLGTACQGLVKSLSKQNVDVSLVLPFSCESEYAKIIDIYNSSKEGSRLKVKKMDFYLKPYITSEQYSSEVEKLRKAKGNKNQYARSLVEEVKRYAAHTPLIVEDEEFDVIHAHDWLTYEAGIAAKEITGKPLVVHVHATEFDRSGGNSPNQEVYEIEKHGMETADVIIAVSNFTKQKIIKHYGIGSDKIIVVHNGVEFPSCDKFYSPFKENNKIVLFLGRITIQKGPDYFVYMSKIVSEHVPEAKFVVAGDGDMKKFMFDKVCELGLLDKYYFVGFLRGKDIENAYKLSHIYVMPSVSEPFGITPLESMANGTPALISKQSGVSELLCHALKVDFWDVEEMANKIIAVLKYDALRETLINNSLREVKKVDWDTAAEKCSTVYKNLLSH